MPFPRIRGGDPIAKTKIEPSGGTHEEPDGSRSRLPDGSKKNIAQNDAPVKKNTFPRIRGGDLKGKRRMVFLPGRLVTDRKAAADEKSGCTNSMEKVYARLHIAIYEILYYHESASDLSLVRRGGTPKIRFFPVEFPTVHLMRIER